jgi:hypothetical protein
MPDMRPVRPKMKTIKIDNDAHAILLGWKERCVEGGIESPAYSDAIRWASRSIGELIRHIK